MIRKVLRDTAAAEGVTVAEDVLHTLATHAEGDLRSAINDLEALCVGRTRVESLGALEVGERNRVETAYQTVATILKTSDAWRAIDAARNLDEPPDFLLAWLDENLPAEYRYPPDLERALNWLGRADVFLGRTRRRQYFALWAYATELMSAGTASAKSRSYPTPPRYEFPSWIRRMGATKGRRGVRAALAEKIGRRIHMGAQPVLTGALPSLASGAAKSPAFAEALCFQCELEEDEIRLLLQDAPETYVDEVVARVERRRAEETGGPPSLGRKTEGPKEARKTSRGRGPTLSDFSS